MNNPTSTPIYLGIDGGGTSCRARLRDASGALLGEGAAGAANVQLGMPQVQAAVVQCTEQALQQAGLGGMPWSDLHAGIGLAGAVSDADIAATADLQALFGQCALHQDAYIACLGAHRGEAGGIVIVGTGSCAQVVCPAETRTFGGWGFALSDDASGAWLGHQALRLVVQIQDGLLPQSALAQLVSETFTQPRELLAWSAHATPADYAQFAPLVFELADAGDAQAHELVSAGCAQLMRLIDATSQYNTGNISLMGGLADSYLRHLPTTIKTQLRPAHADALDGALYMAGLDLWKPDATRTDKL